MKIVESFSKLILLAIIPILGALLSGGLFAMLMKNPSLHSNLMEIFKGNPLLREVTIGAWISGVISYLVGSGIAKTQNELSVTKTVMSMQFAKVIGNFIIVLAFISYLLYVLGHRI